jgi:hypothetical protein
MWRRIAAAVAVTALLTVPGASMASAAVQPSTATVSADSPDFTPSPNKWRKWMIDVTSKLLGASTPDKFRAEQLANEFQYNTGYETLNRQFGIDGIRVNDAGQMVGVKYTPGSPQGTYTDVVIDQLEKNYKLTAGSGQTAVRVPVSAAKTLVKTVAGVGTAVTTYAITAGLTAAALDATAGWFGWDPNGIVCATSAESDGGLIGNPALSKFVMRTLSGQDCSAWDEAADYVKNSDSPDSYSPLVWGTFTLVYTGYGVTYPGGGIRCFTGPTPPPSGYPSLGGGYSVASESTDPGVTQSGPGYIYSNDSGCHGPGYVRPSGGSVGTGLPIVLGPDGSVVAHMTVTKGDPNRTLQCDVKNTDGSTTSGTPTDAYKESAGPMPSPTCPAVPAGKVPASTSITQHTAGSPDQKLYDQPVGTDAQKMFTDYKECLNGACALDLYRKSDGKSCFDLDAGCPGWWDLPSHGTDTYQCRYGMHDVDISECAVYASLFEPGRAATGSPYSDPSTGVWSGAQNAPAEGQTAMGADVQDPALARTCDLSDIGFDPVGWVVRPLQCALQWAFVPRPAVINADGAGAAEKWDGKAPAVLATFVQGAALHPSASGCSKSVTVMGATFDIWNACGGAMATVAGIGRLVIDFGMVVLVIIVIRRQISGMVGYNRGQ